MNNINIVSNIFLIRKRRPATGKIEDEKMKKLKKRQGKIYFITFCSSFFFLIS